MITIYQFGREELFKKGAQFRASHKHIQKYCNEFAYRYNNRKLKNNERFVDFLSGVVNTKLTYKTLTA